MVTESRSFKPYFTPKSQLQISLSASPEISHHKMNNLDFHHFNMMTDDYTTIPHYIIYTDKM